MTRPRPGAGTRSAGGPRVVLGIDGLGTGAAAVVRTDLGGAARKAAFGVRGLRSEGARRHGVVSLRRLPGAGTPVS